MKAVIQGKVFDTAKAKELASFGNGLTRRDYKFVVERLYETKKGALFLHGEGGGLSEYREAVGDNGWASGEQIIPMSREEALAWAEKRELAEDICRLFPDLVQDA